VSADFFDSLRAVVGATRVLAGTEEVAPFCTDWRARYTGTASCVVLPGTTDEVAAVVRICAEAGVAIVPQGGNTGLCGGATPTGGEVVIVLTRLNRIRAVDADNNSITVEAGCTLHAVQEAARVADRLFPLSLAAEGSATIGGNLATNAGGVQVLRYGNARELTLGVEVVLADGRIWNGLRALRKDNTGYDLKHLFIGAEGTLGLITAATLRLHPLSRIQATAWVAVPDPAAAVSLLGRLRDAAGDNVTAFEIVGRPALELVLKHIPNAREPLPGKPAWQLLVELSGARADLSATLESVLAGAVAGRSGRRCRACRQRGADCSAVGLARERLRGAENRGCLDQARHRRAGLAHRRIHRPRRCSSGGGLPRRAHRLLRPHRRRQPALQPVESRCRIQYAVSSRALKR
jgi:FAD/FMN-containing dehydrogenase